MINLARFQLSLVSNLKRDSITIIADILKALLLGRSAGKMAIVYKANMNFDRIKKYLDLLVVTGHVEIIKSDRGSNFYKITEKGREFLTRYEGLMSSFRIPGASRRLDKAEIVVESPS